MLAGRRVVNEERRQLYYEAMVADSFGYTRRRASFCSAWTGSYRVPGSQASGVPARILRRDRVGASRPPQG